MEPVGADRHVVVLHSRTMDLRNPLGIRYAAVLGVVLGFFGYLAVVPLARKSSVGAAFEPSGTVGVELDEVERGTVDKESLS